MAEGRGASLFVYGGEDLGYEKKIETAAGVQVPTQFRARERQVELKRSSARPVHRLRRQRQRSQHRQRKSGLSYANDATPTANTSSTPTAAQNHGAASTATTLTKASSPLPPPKHLNGLDAETKLARTVARVSLWRTLIHLQTCSRWAYRVAIAIQLDASVRLGIINANEGCDQVVICESNSLDQERSSSALPPQPIIILIILRGVLCLSKRHQPL